MGAKGDTKRRMLNEHDNEFFTPDDADGMKGMPDAEEAYNDYSSWMSEMETKAEVERMKDEPPEGETETEGETEKEIPQAKRCFICGKPLDGEGNLYCKEHSYMAAADWEKFEDASAQAFVPIVAYALEKDMLYYRGLLMKQYRNPFNKENLADIIHFERWLFNKKPIKGKDGRRKSLTFSELSMDTVDPVRVIQITHDQVRAEYREKQKYDILRASAKLTADLRKQVKGLEKEVKELRKICQKIQ